MGYLPSFDLSQSETVHDYVMSDAFVSGIKGPVGGGKTVGSCIKILRHASEMPVDRSGYRRSRWAAIRATYPELRTTTVQTWENTFQTVRVAPIVYSSPIRHRITIKPHKFEWLDEDAGIYKGTPGFDLEVWFIALDKPKDVKKLKSLELTGAFVNEGAETPPAIIDMLTARVGRYPARETIPAGDYWCGICYDTNAADETVWTESYEANTPPKIEVELPDGTMFEASWSFFTQPMALLEVDGLGKIIEAGHERRGETVKQTQIMVAAGKRWVVDQYCENFAHLKPGYYHQQITNKKLEWIQRFLQCKRVYIADGLPWVPEFSQMTMVRSVSPDPNLALFAGLDAGGGTLNPAAVWGQLSPLGDWRILAELVIADIGLDRFIDAFMRHHAQKFPGMALQAIYADPAAAQHDQVYNVAVKEYLRRRNLPVQLAPTNDIKTRREAIVLPMGRAIHLPDGTMVPGLLVDPSCNKLVAALSGKWCKKVYERAGGRGVDDKPVKNEHSHPGDALSYLLCGAGEYAVLTKGRKPGQAQGTLQQRAQQPGGIRIQIDHDI